MTDLEVARDLRAAADYLRRHGWLQYELGSNGGPRCLAGALYSAMGREFAFMEEPLASRVAALGFATSCLQKMAGLQAGSAWNDQPGRTVDEVTDRLESTALALEVRALAASPAKNPAPREELVAVA